MRIARIIGVVMVLALAGFFLFAPGIVEGGMNRIAPTKATASPEAIALHRTLQVADLHSDTLMWQRDLLDRADRGHVDLPRLEEGHVALQVFSSVSKTPKGQNYDANGADSDNITLLTVAQLQPVRTWTSLVERSLWHAEKLARAAEASDGRLRFVKSSADLSRLLADRAAGRPVTGALFSVEGLQNLEGRMANLDRLDAAGLRMAGLTHFFDNEVAGSMHGLKKGGLTPFGRQVVAELERRRIVIDIAHASHQTVAEVLAMATRPVVSSHGGVQATCKVNRNLSDDEIRGVAKTGGVIGIGYWDAAVCGTEPANVAAAIAHVRDLVGIDHVGLGSDYDGATTVGFDTAKLALVTQALLDRGFTRDEIAKVMGGNLLRLLGENLAPR
ncbi:dipeptidase [Sphingoaurantiacus capsulatus]|uniref:Dipeptidase n=1 Tax=Sphingoaurantiacus capsulatus TaxID=1771310 RepID=A0ABV7XBA6_9SPHN